MTHKSVLQACAALTAVVLSFCCGFQAFAEETAEDAKAVKTVGPDGIKNFLQPYVDSGQLPGFLSILADKDKILQIDRVGFGDIAAQRGMLEDRLVWMASTTKLLTGAALMTLVDAGKVKLDEPLETYIPELKDYKVAVKNEDGTITLREPASKPTVRQAISHTTGWCHTTPIMERFGFDSLPLQSFGTVMPMIPMMTDPGSYFYSNAGIDLAGVVIENVTGMAYEDYLQKTFFDPLGMKVSSFYPARADQDTKNKAYYWKDGKLTEENTYYRTQPLEDRKIRHAEAGGGWFSTPLEVLKFFQMLANKGVYDGKRYLSEAAIAEMCTNQVPANPDNDRYGIGTMFYKEDGWFGHDGSYGTRCMFNPELGLIRLYITQIEENVPHRNEVRTKWTKISSRRMKELTAENAEGSKQ